MRTADPHAVLGIKPGASQDEIKAAFRAKARALHPDRNGSTQDSVRAFQKVNDAYQILRGGGEGPFTFAGKSADFSAAAFASVFEDLFGDFMGARSAGRRGADVRHDITLTLEEASAGAERAFMLDTTVPCRQCAGSRADGEPKPVSCPNCGGPGEVLSEQAPFLRVMVPCQTCAGEGTIMKNPCSACDGVGNSRDHRKILFRIPPGVESGTRIRLPGQGEPGLRGAPAGDLYLFVRVSGHDVFVRDGSDLRCRVPVSVVTAALGGEAEVPVLGGGIERVSIQAGSQTGHEIIVPGRGMPGQNGAPAGDMIITLVVETPVGLTDRQRSLLEEFAAISEENHPASAGFLDKIRSLLAGA